MRALLCAVCCVLCAGCGTTGGPQSWHRFTFTLDPPRPAAGSVVQVEVLMQRTSQDNDNLNIDGFPIFTLRASAGELRPIGGTSWGEALSVGQWEWQLPEGHDSALLMAEHAYLDAHAIEEVQFE